MLQDNASSRHLDFLYSRINYERSAVPHGSRGLKLARMRELLARLGNPHAPLRIVHIAGTKGKGSTAAMIAAVLSAAGHRTGLYTSPHLDRLEERIAVDGQCCEPQRLDDYLSQVRPIVESMDRAVAANGSATAGPTFFEIITAVALLHFARSQLDFTILEAGLGGRLDSTNVCQPCVSVITSISHDHTKQLGNTLAAIAREKAGIIKPGVPVVTGVVQSEPRNVIQDVARRQQTRLSALGGNFDFRYRYPADPGHGDAEMRTGLVDYWEHDSARCLEGIKLGMLGKHQGHNAAVALATLGLLERKGWSLPESAVRQGLARACCPARVEVLSRRPTVLIDVAHNVASVAALADVLQSGFPSRPRWLLFAASRDKDLKGMLRCLLPEFDRVLMTRFVNNPRSAEPSHLAAVARELLQEGQTQPAATQLLVCDHPRKAWETVWAGAGPDELICVTGSFFIAAEIRPLVQSLPHSCLCATS